MSHISKITRTQWFENDRELTLPAITAVPPKDKKIYQTKLVCHYCEKPGHAFRKYRKTMKNEQEQRKDASIQNTKFFHPVLIANKQIILQKKSGAVPMSLKHPNGSNRIIQ